jgi:Spy/CpxP family protein refolding chaperone
MMKRTMFTAPWLAVTLMAQPAPPQAPPVQALKQFLSLSDAQVTQLTQLRREQGQAVHLIAQQIREKETSLQRLLEGGGADAAAVGRLVLDINALRKQIRETDERYQAQARQVLTVAQQEKLGVLVEAAKLQPAIAQAVSLNLITPPQPPAPPSPPGRPAGPPRLLPPDGDD